MVLLMHLYSICGELSEELFTPEIEDRLQGLIAEIIVEESENLSDAFQEFGNFSYRKVAFYIIYVRSYSWTAGR